MTEYRVGEVVRDGPRCRWLCIGKVDRERLSSCYVTLLSPDGSTVFRFFEKMEDWGVSVPSSVFAAAAVDSWADWYQTSFAEACLRIRARNPQRKKSTAAQTAGKADLEWERQS